MGKKRVMILDASAFISGFDPLTVEVDEYSVPLVREELTDRSMPKLRMEEAIRQNKLKIVEPKPRFLEMVKELSREVGDILFLSKADMQILALAIQLREEEFEPLIVTDDYSIQNVARRMGVEFTPLMTFGIRFFLSWLLYCPACHRKYPSNYQFRICEVCGTPLRRKPMRKEMLRGSSR